MEWNDLILIAGTVKLALALSCPLMAEGHRRDYRENANP